MHMRYLKLHPILVIAAPLAAFGLALANGFHYDDGHSLLRNPHIRSLEALGAFFVDPTLFSENPAYAMYRPLVLVAHAFNYALGGYQAAGYIAFNLLVHAANALLVWIVLRRLDRPPLAALLGALLFGLLPPHSEVVNYISSRSESMAALFFLAAFILLIRAEKPLSACYGVALACFGLALLSKATALALPLVFALYSLLLRRRPLSLQWPLWLMSGLYFFIYKSLSPSSLDASLSLRTPLEQWSTQTKALVHYLKLAVVPVQLNVHPQFSVAATPLAAAVVLAALLALSLLWLGRRRALVAFGSGFFLLCLAPTLILPLRVLVNDHRLYLPSVGLIVLLTALVQSALQQPRLRQALFALCGVFALLGCERTLQWRDERSLWQAAAAQAPQMPEAHYNLGWALHQEGDLPGALQSYRRSVELLPAYARAQANLGAVLYQLGRTAEAITALQRARALDPTVIEVYNNLGLAYAATQQWDAAIGSYRQGLALNDRQADLWFNLGLAQRNAGQKAAAQKSLMRAIKLDPGLKQRFSTQ